VEPLRDESVLAMPPPFGWHPRPKFQDRVQLHVLLLVLTLLTTTLAGANLYGAFLTGFRETALTLPLWTLLIHGLWYSGTIIAILGCHELGHYLACRYYDVDASLPFFLPVPFILMTGTLGAVIRIREPIPQKRMLFDIGIAGPIAGFLVAAPALFIGSGMSNIVPLPDPLPPGTIALGEPLLYRLASWLFWGTIPDGYTLNMHPMLFGAWFGLVATMLNLFPIGQLDGGHISYAVLGRKSSYVTLGMIGVAVALSYFSVSWWLFTGLTIVMVVAFGRHHPAVADEYLPLDRTRLVLAVVALIIFIVCFSPAPIQPIDLIR
jgi:membrane-associated protease RseP (regulator of RpoE activity)